MACAFICSNGSFLVLNIVFWLAAGLMLAFGIVGLIDPSSVEEIFSFVIAPDRQIYIQGSGAELNDIVQGNSIYMVVVGGASVLMATLGILCSCCRQRKCPLCFYAVVMVPIWLAEIALVVFPAAYGYTVQLSIHENMAQTLKTNFYYDITVDRNGTVGLPENAVDMSWATLQLRERCCGSYSYSDYRKFSWQASTVKVVPQSCCVQTLDSSFPSAVRFIDVQKCQEGNHQYIYQKSCYAAISGDIETFTQRHKGIASGLAAGTSVLQISLIFLALILVARVRRDQQRLKAVKTAVDLKQLALVHRTQRLSSR